MWGSKDAECTHESKAQPDKDDSGDSRLGMLEERATPLEGAGMHINVGYEGRIRTPAQHVLSDLGGRLAAARPAGRTIEAVGNGVALALREAVEVRAATEVRRSSPFVFSVAPRCRGCCGSQK